jgi:small-conductance mechanosensitive channel
VNDADVETTLREIREGARAAARAAAAERVAPAPPSPAPIPARASGTKALLRRLARPVLARMAVWMSRAMMERLALIEGSLGRSIGEVRSIVTGQEQRLQQLEGEQVRLRQSVLQLEEDQVRLRRVVLQLDEAAQLADRSRRGALLRIEELEARSGRPDTVPRRPAS